MRKLTTFETRACRFLSQFGERGFCPAFADVGPEEQQVIKVLDSLVKKGRATRTVADAGPLYRLTSEGYADAA